MNVTPIQIRHDGIRIPIEYVGDVREFILVVEENAIWVLPKQNGFYSEITEPPEPQIGWLQKMIGTVETSNPTASSDVEKILAEEMGMTKRNE